MFYSNTSRAATAKQNWAPLPADKHTGSWELPAWRCLVVGSEERKKKDHYIIWLQWRLNPFFFFFFKSLNLVGKHELSLSKDANYSSVAQCCSPVASLILILTDRLNAKDVIRTSARNRACPLSHKKRPETLTHFPGEWQLQDGGMVAPQSL